MTVDHFALRGMGGGETAGDRSDEHKRAGQANRWMEHRKLSFHWVSGIEADPGPRGPAGALRLERRPRIDRACSIISTTISPAGWIALTCLTLLEPAGMSISSRSPMVSGVGTMALHLGIS